MNRLPVVEPRPYLLDNKIQHYAWGTKGERAFIPRLLGIEPEPGYPYAELWIGTHVRAPSDVIVRGSPISLRQLISQHPLETLGDAVLSRFGETLPFLLKVLSAGEALSIQVHPTREQAQVLNSRDPEHYPDDNHKPELAVALDSLTALMGFKSFSGLLETLEQYPELTCFIGQSTYRRLSDSRERPYPEQQGLVRSMYATLVKRSIADQEELGRVITHLDERLNKSTGSLPEEARVFLDLRKTYPEPDVGLLSVFLMNLIHLEKGQAVFLKAGIPHAYLEGNIVECMANSDNVVRAGLTHKFKDVETLTEILTYELGPVTILESDPASHGCRAIGMAASDGALSAVTYQTDASEFQVSRMKIEPGREIHVRGSGPRILLLIEGEVHIKWSSGPGGGEESLRQGQSVFIPACLREFQITSNSSTELFMAEVPSH